MRTGRPKIEITDEMIAKVESFASQGLTIDQIARSLGMAPSTFYNKKKEIKELLEVIKNGQAKGIATITNALFKKAKGGDNISMIFYLKNRDPNNWEEVQKRQHSGQVLIAEKISKDMSDEDASTIYKRTMRKE